ncbi:MAG: hypothetical protein GX259_09380 [Bacteroidales bacterium]|nr:hypothetical protein [Bacteroidales bacterium]
MKIYTTILFSLIIKIACSQFLSSSLHDVFSDNAYKPHSSLNVFSSDTLKSLVLNKGKLVEFAPLLGVDVMYGSELAYNTALGYSLQTDKNKKFSADFSILFEIADYPSFVGEKFDTLNVFPYSGKKVFSKSSMNGAFSLPLLLKYNINDVFSLEGGNGKTFLGDGYRSVLLSDQCAEYPFLRMNADLKKVKYMHQISRWRQELASGDSETKFSATHYLSWMITKKINLSVFESVVWRATDTVRQRGMEWLYLNPVLFFRPAEFSIGSPDNMLIGANVSWNVFNKTKLYAQVVLDEFFISEIKNWIKHLYNRSDSTIPYGAWVNKQAFQFGVKSSDLFGLEGLSCLLEFNYARPYIWSHRDPMLSNSNMNQPVAHPYGANFYEFVFKSEYRKEKWGLCFNAGYYKTGLDSAGINFGQDILAVTFDSNIGGNIPVQYYGNKVGQGVSKNTIHVDAEYLRNIKINNNLLKWRIGVLCRMNKIEQISQTPDFYVYTGLYLNLFPKKWD